MLSQSQNRVQAIKSKFENLNSDKPLLTKKIGSKQLCKTTSLNEYTKNECCDKENSENELFADKTESDSDPSSEDYAVKPNTSYLYSKHDPKQKLGESKKSLSRQSSDPGKKLHRSHAFRCDKSKKIADSPKRHESCYGRPETSNFSVNMGEKKLSESRLKKLGCLLEDQMRKEGFLPSMSKETNINSISDDKVPQHIRDMYAKVVKPKKEVENKQDAMTDSGVSSETENADDDKNGRVRKLTSQFEKTESLKPEKDTNLHLMNPLCISSETIRLERKNPHLVLTDTLKKALKQPLPPGPPPQKPPRSFAITTIPESPEKPKKDAKMMLEKLEQALSKKEAQKESKNIYDIAETDLSLSRPKDVHYLCTEILDITQRTMMLPKSEQHINDPLKRCLGSLNCTLSHSSSTLPYVRLSTGSVSNTKSCSCSSTSIDDTRGFSSFIAEPKTQEFSDNSNVKSGCDCKRDSYSDNEHIYDIPFNEKSSNNRASENKYGSLNIVRLKQSKSLEDLRKTEEQKIYDIPCELSRPATPEPTNFQNLLKTFEKGCNTWKLAKTKSSEDLVKKPMFATVRERKGRFSGSRTSLKKDSRQLDEDRENLNRLMNEIYETVSAACTVMENKPGSFPTESPDGSTSEDSVKLTRSLTEKRKNYVRRVSSKVAYLEPKNKNLRFRHQTSVCSYKSETLKNDNPYSTFRSWKSFRTSQNNLTATAKMADDSLNLTGESVSMDDVDVSGASVDNLSIDEKAGCVDIELPFEPREKGLFNVCLLVGLNYLTGEAYVKSVFPSQVQVPPHIQNLVFPETISSDTEGGEEWSAEEASSQCYSIVLTDERGERSYGYCRRVLPEGASVCLPLCYCIIGKYRAPGFYYKVLQEIESHHGSSEVEINYILQQLFEIDFPSPGEQITLSYKKTILEPARTNNVDLSRVSLNLEAYKCKTLPDLRRSNASECGEDVENNNNFGLDRPSTKILKRPLEPRVEEDNLSSMLDCLGAGLLVKVFSSLLLERKVIIISDQLSELSACIEGLQGALYPLVWQQPLISCVPRALRRDVLAAPLPLLAAALAQGGGTVAPTVIEGMLIDLTQPSKVVCFQGDESTILPTHCFKTLKNALHMESSRHKDSKTQDTKTRNVMISEAFLRFFVDILGDYKRFLRPGELKDGEMGKGNLVFDNEAFIKSASTKQNQYFLEWFTETAMFNHFIQNMASSAQSLPLVDCPLPNYYSVFTERMRSRKTAPQNKTHYKNALNKRVAALKAKLKEIL